MLYDIPIKIKIVLGALIGLVVAMALTPFLITDGASFASQETIEAFFLMIEFGGSVYLLNEFNRLRILHKEQQESERLLTSIASDTSQIATKTSQIDHKLSTFGTSRLGMKGIVLAGGTATRLFPLTATISKQLLPVYDKQMVFYSLNTLIKAGIRDILMIVSPDHSGQYLNLLGSIFKNYGVHLYFEVQKVPGGLAEAFVMGESFIGDDNVTLILGDNIFEDDFTEAIKNFKSGGHIFGKKVPDPERFGVVKFDSNGKAEKIVEKPKKWISDYAIPGIYVYDKEVATVAKNLKPSERGELEIVDLHNYYLDKGQLTVSVLDGEWLDAGTFDSLLEAGNIVKEKKIAENFHPLIIDAIADFNNELKIRTKKVLDVYNLELRPELGQKK